MLGSLLFDDRLLNRGDPALVDCDRLTLAARDTGSAAAGIIAIKKGSIFGLFCMHFIGEFMAALI